MQMCVFPRSQGPCSPLLTWLGLQSVLCEDERAQSSASQVLVPCVLAETIEFHDPDGAGFRAARLGTQQPRKC